MPTKTTSTKWMLELQRRQEPHVIQAFLKTDLEWTSILLYDCKAKAMRGMKKLKRLEPPPRHELRVRKWQGEAIFTNAGYLTRFTVAA